MYTLPIYKLIKINEKIWLILAFVEKKNKLFCCTMEFVSDVFVFFSLQLKS